MYSVDHWIVTHNPHPVPDTHPWHIYSKVKRKTYPKIDDLIIFYETESTYPGRDRPGEKAVVSAARVSGPFQSLSNPIGRYVFEIPCDRHRPARKIVPYEEVREIVPWFVWPKGWSRLAPQEYRALIAAMGLSD
jgi:hypothetical protein